MLGLLLIICIIVVIAMAAATFLDWRWPLAPLPRLTLIAGLFLPTLFLLAFTAAMILIFRGDDCPPEVVCDAGGMAVAALFFLGGWGLFASLLIGLPASYLTLRFLRKP